MMHFTVEHPLGQHGCSPGLYDPSGMAAVARAAETAGFDAIAFTEHPAPPRWWVDQGGHPSMDPLAALAFCAAATERIALQTHLVVLPYHSPLLLAKTVATVDHLSGGRLVLGVGSGYLRDEFAAVGVDFEARTERFDDAVEVLRTVWRQPEFSHGSAFLDARSVLSQPAPVQLPHPPLWFGGTSRMARSRAARYGQGWMVLLMNKRLAKATRSVSITTVAELAAAIRDLRLMVEEAGRACDSVHVQVYAPESLVCSMADADVERHLDFLSTLVDAGADWFVVRPPASGLSQCCEALAAYGEQIIARLH